MQNISTVQRQMSRKAFFGAEQPHTYTVHNEVVTNSYRHFSCYHSSPMVLALALILLLSSLANTSQARRSQKRLIIHVPFRIKTHHHTHTVYAHIRSAAGGSTGSGHKASGGKQQTIYKILSFAMQGNGYGGPTGHGGHSGHGQVAHKSGHGGNHGGGGVEGGYEHEIAPAAHEHHSQSAVMYDDFHGGGGGGERGERAGRCSDAPHGYGDMLFNHFSRSSDESNESDEFPEVEEYVDEDEQGFEWE